MATHETKYWTPEEIADLTDKVYRLRLEDDSPGNVARMLSKDRKEDPEDGGKKLRARSRSYQNAVFATLRALDLHQPKKSTGKTKS